MRKGALLIFALFLIILGMVFAVSAPEAVASAGWTRTYKGETMDILTPASVVQTSDGGYATTILVEARRVDNVGYQGHFTQFFELQVMKTSSLGDVQWRQNFTQINDPKNDAPTLYVDSRPYIIVQTTDQGYTIATSGSGNFWLFKLDNQGRILWSKTYAQSEDASSNSYLNSMILTNDGGFALAGSTITYEGDEDFCLVKIDSSGRAQWNQTYNSGSYKDGSGTENHREDQAKCIIQTRDGGYALAGSASLFRASTSSIVYASWIVKTDAQGKQQWNKGYDFPNDQARDYSLIQTTDGGYALAGTQNSDFCLMKIDSTGQQLQWSKTFGGEQTDVPCRVVQLNDGGYAVAGTWTKTNSTATVQTVGLLRLDSSGQTMWVKTYNAKESLPFVSYDTATAMTRTNDGGYVIVGSTMMSNENHQDVFFVKTETLEQPPQTTATPTSSSVQSATPGTTPKETTTSSASPITSTSATSIPTSNPSTSANPSSTSSDSSPTPSPSIPEISSWLTLPIVVALTAIILFLRKNKVND